MSNIIERLQSMPYFFAMRGASAAQIELAEQALGLRFSDEYRAYTSAFGAASCDGHELTGVVPAPRLNVVDVTLAERALNPTIPPNYYVVEQANIDGIVIWQSSTGEVWQTILNTPLRKLCESLCEYLEL